MKPGERKFVAASRAHPEYGYDYDEVFVVAASAAAIKVRTLHQKPGTVFWVPKTQIHTDSEVFAQGDRGMLIVNSWFAQKLNWIQLPGSPVKKTTKVKNQVDTQLAFY